MRLRIPTSPSEHPVLVAAAAGVLWSVLLFGSVAFDTSPEAEISYTAHFEPGSYACARCGSALFESADKFKSATRWPSFRRALDGAVATRPDHSEGLDRVEALCARCGAHLGHVFPDGRLAGDEHPQAGDRYCVLSKSLRFLP